jgi:hypothetical protein
VWCGLLEQTQEYEPIAQWSDETWQSATVHLHPQVITDKFRAALNDCVTGAKIFELSRVCQLAELSLIIDSQGAGCLLPLLEMPRSIEVLVKWWQKLRPFNPVTQEPTSETEALERVKGLLMPLEENGYVMLERNA